MSSYLFTKPVCIKTMNSTSNPDLIMETRISSTYSRTITCATRRSFMNVPTTCHENCTGFRLLMMFIVHNQYCYLLLHCWIIIKTMSKHSTYSKFGKVRLIQEKVGYGCLQKVPTYLVTRETSR